MKIYRTAGSYIKTLKLLFIAGVVAVSPLGLGGVTHAVVQANIVGTVTNQSGAPLSGVRVTAIDPGGGYLAGQDVYTVTASDGTYDLDVQYAGTYDIIFTEPTQTYGAFVAHDITAQNTQTLDAQLSSETHTITGIVQDDKGNPIPDLKVSMRSALNIYGLSYTARTSMTGQFTITALAGYYDPLNFGGLYSPVVVGGYTLASPNIGPWNGERTGDPTMINLYDGNVTQDIRLSFVKLTVAVKDSAGSPVQGKYAFIRGLDNPKSTTSVTSNGADYLRHAGPSSYGGYTGVDGTYTALVPKGSEYFPGQVCVANTSVASYTSCNSGIVPTMNTYIASSDLTILFQGDPIVEQEAAPVAPVNLAVEPFTQGTPAITWDAVPGAESYNIYRNNTRVGSSATNTFIDDSAPTGSQSYTVAAVAGNMASGLSDSVTTIVDRTLPNIEYVQSPAANSNGWNNSNVTVTFTCSDRYGIDTCPSPVEVSNEGVSQMISGAAVDKAGNTASRSVTVNLDKTPPMITASSSPSFNTSGWNNSAVTITYTCSDMLSGIQDCPDPVTVGGQGADQEIVGIATDNAGNSASVTTTLNIDKTAPVISYNVNPAANINDWNNSNVTVTFTCGDVLSGIQSCPSPVTVNTEGSSQAVTGTAVDKAGNSTSVTATLNIDTTAPAITASPDVAPNANGWNNTTIVISFTCHDALSGIATCTGPLTLNNEGIGQIATGTATDNAGNSASATASASIDKTPPTIGYIISPAPNANGWNDSDANISFNCDDALSGIQACSSPVTISTEGADQAITGTATDNADNSATTIAHVNLDKVAPTISYSVSPAVNSNGWNNGDVTVTFTCSDSLSGIQSCPAPVTVDAEGAESVTGTAVDKAGNSSSTTAHISLDKTAPTITASVSSQPNANGWNSGVVTITFSCNDALSGVDTCTPPVTVSNEGANQIVTGTVVDKAGNAATTAATVSIDKTKPTIVATQSPAPNANGWNNTNVVVTYTCSDATSGISSCSSPTTLNTEGNNLSATGTAVDNAGNTNSVTVSPIKIDKTAPTASTPTVSNTFIILTRPTQTYTATVSDALSGAAGGEFYMSTTDPGTGNGTPMTYSAGKITGTMSTSGLSAGTYTVNMRSKDTAGNWSAVVTKTFTIIL